jgi:cobalamin biosynthesis protein CobD/CbiB
VSDLWIDRYLRPCLYRTRALDWQRNAARRRKKRTLWYGLCAVTFLAMLLVGMQTGYGLRRSNLALLVLALVFSAVILLIVDLDSAQKGARNVSEQPMIDLQRQLHGATP